MLTKFKTVEELFDLVLKNNKNYFEAVNDMQRILKEPLYLSPKAVVSRIFDDNVTPSNEVIVDILTNESISSSQYRDCIRCVGRHIPTAAEIMLDVIPMNHHNMEEILKKNLLGTSSIYNITFNPTKGFLYSQAFVDSVMNGEIYQSALPDKTIWKTTSGDATRKVNFLLTKGKKCLVGGLQAPVNNRIKHRYGFKQFYRNEDKDITSIIEKEFFNELLGNLTRVEPPVCRSPIPINSTCWLTIKASQISEFMKKYDITLNDLYNIIRQNNEWLISYNTKNRRIEIFGKVGEQRNSSNQSMTLNTSSRNGTGRMIISPDNNYIQPSYVGMEFNSSWVDDNVSDAVLQRPPENAPNRAIQEQQFNYIRAAELLSRQRQTIRSTSQEERVSNGEPFNTF